MENTSIMLTVKDMAEILRCSKAHVANVLAGKIPGLARLTHVNVGRRKLVRRDWFERWIEVNQSK
jgi:Helix-turn-helix domain